MMDKLLARNWVIFHGKWVIAPVSLQKDMKKKLYASHLGTVPKRPIWNWAVWTVLEYASFGRSDDIMISLFSYKWAKLRKKIITRLRELVFKTLSRYPHLISRTSSLASSHWEYSSMSRKVFLPIFRYCFSKKATDLNGLWRPSGHLDGHRM